MFERFRKKKADDGAKEEVIPVVLLAEVDKVVEHRMQEVLKNILAVESTDLVSMIATVKDLLGPKEDVSKVKRELANLRLDKEIEIRDIEHLVKCKGEKLELDFRKKELKLKDDFKTKEMDLQKQYHDKTLELLEKSREQTQQIHAEIMKRLPNVNMAVEVSNQKKPKS